MGYFEKLLWKEENMDYIIETRNLTKKYGKHVAADNVNLHVKRGEIYGFIGRNGAGKTTCMKVLCSLANQTDGEVILFGKKGSEAAPLRKKIGSLIEEPGLYYNLSAYDNLKCKCLMSGVKPGCIKEYLELVGLQNTGKKKAKGFSLGMRQRLGIAMALIGEPEVLILDEPINGLDPDGIAQMRELFVRLRDEKKMTIMISSHILEELSKVADTFGIIESGKLVKEISHDELMSSCESGVQIRTDAPQKALDLLIKEGYEGASIISDDTVLLKGNTEKTAGINTMLVTSGCSVSEIKIVHKDIEQYYFEITSGGHING